MNTFTYIYKHVMINHIYVNVSIDQIVGELKMESCVHEISKTTQEKDNENVSTAQELTGDIVISVNGAQFFCNKKKLMESSEFFRGMFESEMKEANSKFVQLEETDIETLSAVVDFCRTGQLDLTVDNVHQVAVIASKYQVITCFLLHLRERERERERERFSIVQ